MAVSREMNPLPLRPAFADCYIRHVNRANYPALAVDKAESFRLSDKRSGLGGNRVRQRFEPNVVRRDGDGRGMHLPLFPVHLGRTERGRDIRGAGFLPTNYYPSRYCRAKPLSRGTIIPPNTASRHTPRSLRARAPPPRGSTRTRCAPSATQRATRRSAPRYREPQSRARRSAPGER